MECFTAKTDQSEKLQSAFLLYGTFATVHAVENRKDGPVILPGSLATKEGLVQAMCALLPPDEQGTGLIPDTLLASGVGHMVWWVKPSHRTLWFSAKEFGGQKSATMPLPGLVMVTTPDCWRVFAVKGNARPTPTTKLYVAPFFNVWEHGRICTGTARVPDDGNRNDPEQWNRAFFESYFTHPNIHEVNGLVKEKEGSYAFWRDMLEGKYEKFPQTKLVGTDLTLESMYRRMVLGGTQ